MEDRRQEQESEGAVVHFSQEMSNDPVVDLAQSSVASLRSQEVMGDRRQEQESKGAVVHFSQETPNDPVMDLLQSSVTPLRGISSAVGPLSGNNNMVFHNCNININVQGSGSDQPLSMTPGARDFSPFARLKVTVSDSLKREELEMLADLFELNPREKEQFNNSTASPGLAFIRILEMKGYFTAKDVDRFIYGLQQIGKIQLAEIVLQYKKDHISIKQATDIPGNDHSFQYQRGNSGQSCWNSAAHPTVECEASLPGRNDPADQYGDDQIIIFPVEERDNYPTCVLSMDISSDAMDSQKQRACVSFQDRLKNHILRAPSGYIDHLSDIFIFFRGLYGDLAKITFESIQFHVRVPSLSALDLLRKDCESGYIRDELAVLLLPENVRMQMDRQGLYLTCLLDFESVKDVRHHIIGGIQDLDPEGIQGMALFCDYCKVIFDEEWEHEYHIKSQEHHEKIAAKQGNKEWCHRQPPLAVTNGNFKICRIQDCQYFLEGDEKNHCDYAHTEDELQEWKDRHAQRLKDIQSIRNQTLSSSREKGKVKKSKRWSKKIAKVNNEENLETYGPITYNEDCKIAEGSFTSLIFVGSYKDEDVAVKQVPTHALQKELELYERMKDMELNNVLKMLHIEKGKHVTHIVTHLCEFDLSEIIENPDSCTAGPSLLSPQKRVSICVEILNGLKHLHSLDIVHRDLKPRNILLDVNGTAHVADFGISRSVRGQTTRYTLAMGTECWMASENCTSNKIKNTKESDVQVAGFLVYYVLSNGHHPFETTFPYTDDMQALTAKLRGGNFSLEHVKDYPEACASLLQRMLDKDPTARPTIAKCLEELKAVECSYSSSFQTDILTSEDLTLTLPDVKVICGTRFRVYLPGKKQKKKEVRHQWRIRVTCGKEKLEKVYLWSMHEGKFYLSHPCEQSQPQECPASKLQEDQRGGYIFTVHFKTSQQGCFHEWLMFKFGNKNLCKQIIVWVGPAFADRFPHSDDPSIPWDLGNHNVIKYPLHPDNFLENLKEKYCLPEELPEFTELEHPTSDNFREYFHKMVHTEEWACIDKLKKYNGKLIMNLKDQVSINNQGSFLPPEGQLFGEVQLKVPLDDSEASQVVHKWVHIILLKFDLSGDVFEAKIADENMLDLREVDCFYVYLSSDCVHYQKLEAGKQVEVDVQFQVDRNMFCNFHFAIDSVRTKELLFPPRDMFPRFFEEECSSVAENTTDRCLNHRQEEAKKFILGAKDSVPFRQGPSLIIGPFGTGKTLTLAKIVGDLLQQDESSKLLICTHSDSAADDFITKHLQVFLEESPQGTVLRQYAPERNPDNVPDEMKKYCHITQEHRMKKFVKPTARIVRGFRVVVTTLSTSFFLTILPELRGVFTYIFIDEAGQALETETMIPLGLAGPRTVVVLAGDHKQMRPKVFSQVARKFGFKKSMLERLFYWSKDYNCNITHFLTDNYRMRQEILDFIGTHCYQVEQFSSKVKEVPQTSFYPIAFSAVEGKEELEGLSYKNEKEALEIVKQIEELQSQWPSEWGNFAEDKIVVLTPYKLQVRILKQFLKMKRLQEIPVETIQNVQGKQFDVVFISPVRTVHTANKGDYFSVLSDEGELVTAFTRVKNYLFVVGDPVSLCSVGECKEIWKKYLQVCEQNKSLKPVDVSYKSIEEQIAEIQSIQDVNASEVDEPSAISEDLSSLVVQPEQQQEIPCSPGSQDYDTDVEFEDIDEDLEDEILKEMNIQVQKERQREDSESASASSPTEPSGEIASDDETLQQLPTPTKRGRKTRWINFRLLEGGEKLDLVGIKFTDSYDRSKLEGGYDPEYVEEESEEMDEEQKEKYIQMTKDEPDRYCVCVLRFAENYLVDAVPVSNHPASKIRISSKKKRKRALDGDQVVVRTWRRNDVTYGEVMCILKRAEKLKWKQIVCTIDSENIGLMCPVGNTLLPKMFIYPKGAKMVTGSRDVKIEIHSIKPKRKPIIKRERIVRVKFNEMGHKLFVVQYSNWFSTCPYPMGIVTEELPPCNTLEPGLHILQLIHGVKDKWSLSLLNRVTQQFPEQWEIPQKEMIKRKKYDFRKKLVFTIGKADLRDCDHAMHIETLADGKVVLGLHLADVPFFVQKDSDVDLEALRRGSSFFAPFTNPSHMLPHVLSTQLCNFSLNHDRLAVSIVLTFDQSGTSVENSIICRSIVCCKQNLTYANVENFLLNRNFDKYFDFKQEVMQQVEALYKLTASIPQAQVICTENEDQINFPLAYEIVESVRKLVATEVAKQLNCESQGQLPVCRQLLPQQQDLEDWHQRYKEDMHTISHLPHSIVLNMEDTSHTTGMLPVLQTQWKEIKQAIRSDRDKLLELKRILKCKDGHPKQAVALAQLDTITPAEEFIFIANEKQGFHLFCLQENHAHPFMAPTRSYMDLIVLRLLVAHLEKTANPYSEEDLSHVAYHCTKQTLSARKYEKSAHMFVFALKLKSVPHQLEALVQMATEDELAFVYPFRGFLNNSHSSTHVPLRLLKPGKRPQDGKVEGRSIQLNWRNRIYNYKSEAPVIRDNKSVFWLFTDIHVRNIPVSFLEAILKSVERKEYDHVEKLETEWNEIEIRESERSTLPEDSRSELIKEISCERMNTNEGLSELRKYVEFNRQFNPGHVVELQLCAGLEQGILGPMVQLFKMTPKFDLCLEHRGMPVECFTEIADKLPAKCETVSEYVKAWLPLLKMLVAYNTLMNDETILIQDVSIRWSKEDVGLSEETVYGHFSLDKVWCDDRQITFGTLPKKRKDIRGFLDPTEKFLVSDYICVRLHGYEINEGQQFQLGKLGSKSTDNCLKTDIPTPKMSTLVVHGVAGTTNIGSKAKVKEYDVEFQVTHKSCKIPQHLFDEEDPTKVQCTVELIPKSEPEKRMEDALANVENSDPLIVNIVLQNPEKMLESKNEILEKLLKEGSKVQDKSFRAFFGNQPPNRSQSEALRKALSQPFTVIQGPPGTGKTRTGAYLTTFFSQINKKVFPRHKKSQILYCGPSNKSVDVITEYLQKFENKKLKFVRVYSDTIEQQTYPVPGVESAERKFGYVENIQTSEEVKKHALHHLIRSDEAGGNGKRIRQLDRQFKERTLEPTLQNVRDYKKLVADTKLAILKNRDIILCTCNAAGHYMFKENLNIVQCIIDEAGMCFELDTLIPLVSQQPKQVVLIGDHKQLRPIIPDPHAKQLGAEISLMEKFKGIAYTLTIQYRMHEEICKFPSQQFYNSKLETDGSVKTRGQLLKPEIWPGKDHHPRVFCHVEGKEYAQTVRTAEGNEMSRSNEKEANEVVRIANTLVRKFNVECKNLIILSQYRLQCMLIKNKLKSKQQLKGVKVQTVIKSQGSEWDYVILSTVRSLPEDDIPESPGKSWKRQNLGFIEDENQMNVGLTRAKRGLIIIGNKHLLNKCVRWRELIKHYGETNSVVEADQFLKF